MYKDAYSLSTFMFGLSKHSSKNQQIALLGGGKKRGISFEFNLYQWTLDVNLGTRKVLTPKHANTGPWLLLFPLLSGFP